MKQLLKDILLFIEFIIIFAQFSKIHDSIHFYTFEKKSKMIRITFGLSTFVITFRPLASCCYLFMLKTMYQTFQDFFKFQKLVVKSDAKQIDG